MKKRDNKGINVLKAISCIAVVFMHCRFPGQFGSLIAYVLRFPVSIFFMISGYYGFNKDDKWIRNKAIYLLKMILLSEGFYLVLNSVVQMLNGKSISFYALDILSKTPIWKMVFFGPLFCGPLWYLYAAFWTWIIILLIRKACSRGEESVFWLIPVLFLTAILGRNYCSRFTDPEETIYIFRSALLYGLPFSLLGAFLKRLQESSRKINRIQACALCAVGMLFIVVEYLISPTIHDFQLSTLFISVGLFIIFEGTYILVGLDWLSYLGAKMSLWVYLLHVGFRTIVDQIAKTVDLNTSIIFNWFRPIIILSLTLMTSYALSKLVALKEDKKVSN